MSNLDRKLAASIHKEFKSRPHSQYIASEFALYHIASLLSTHKIQSVLEIGAGIGTITRLLLVHPKRPPRVLSTENNPVCFSELRKNLSDLDKEGWTVVGGHDDIDLTKTFDLVIFDGDIKFDRLSPLFKDGVWCFVEGSRLGTRNDFANSLRQNGLNIEFKNYLPGGRKFYFRKIDKLFGLPIPWLKKIKGCHIGRSSPI